MPESGLPIRVYEDHDMWHVDYGEGETEEGDHVSTTSVGTTGATVDLDDHNRFDFSDTDFNGGMNFIVGMRKQSGMFFDMKATAWGVSNIRLLAGFNF